MIRWKLNQVMARHRDTGKSLVEFLGISTNAMSSLRKAQAMPRIDGERLEQLCIGITRLSKIGEKVLPYDLLEYISDPENEPKILSHKQPSAGRQKASDHFRETLGDKGDKGDKGQFLAGQLFLPRGTRKRKKTQAAVASATEAASELSLKKTQEAA